MIFQKLSEYFEELEKTASRNAMVEILARLFSESKAEEIDRIVYLTQGRVAPLFEPVEFGMAEKMVIKAMALAYGKSGEEVTTAFKKSGDLGETAQVLANEHREEKGYGVIKVFEILKLIAETGGTGSVEKKISILAELLKNVDGLSARYVARIPVDKMRLGFSDMTVLEGLSWMIDGSKKNKEVMEAAYNIRPDLGEIARIAKSEGVAGFVDHGGNIKIKPKVGTPVLVMRAERLTSAAEILEKVGGKVAVEPKLDGLRTQLHVGKTVSGGARIFSRGLENVTNMYPDLVDAAKKELRVSEFILDGEAIGFDPSTGSFVGFQQTTQRKRKYDVETFAKNIPVKLVVFDVLYYEGKSFINEPYEKRRELVEKITRGNKTIVAADMELVSEPKKLVDFFQRCLSKNLEGIVAKKLDGVYQAGARGWNWIKLKSSYTESKLNDTIDAVVMGLDFGQGKRNAFGVGAFLIGVYDQKNDSFKTISKVGTGLTDEEWRKLAASGKELAVREKPKKYDVNKVMNCDTWLQPKLVGEFLADEITKSPIHTAGYALRFPRLVKWREKRPEDTTSLKEIVEMVGLQKK